MYRTLLIAVPLSLCASCGGSSVDTVSGVVTVDGQPVDAGTIALRAEGSGGPPAGGAISAGEFTVVCREPLAPGTYAVTVQASRKTGRVVKDPQRGDIEELKPLVLADSPRQVELTAENATSLALDFKSSRP